MKCRKAALGVTVGTAGTHPSRSLLLQSWGGRESSQDFGLDVWGQGRRERGGETLHTRHRVSPYSVVNELKVKKECGMLYRGKFFIFLFVFCVTYVKLGEKKISQCGMIEAL